MVDGTLGGGGHAELLLEGGASVIGVDRDPTALEASAERLARFTGFSQRRGNFGDLPKLLDEPVDGVVLDLGVSSTQLDLPERGFSFAHEGPLDMRMGPEGETAAELIARLDERTLAKILREFGEEPFAGRIAKTLKRELPTTTRQAAEAVERAVPRKAWPERIHVATRTFQALRIAVNGELDALDRFLGALPEILKLGGRAAVISFHSLEDRRVKRAFVDLEGRCKCPPGFPECRCGAQATFKRLTRKAVVASETEVRDNPRARSARLRAVERIR